MIVKSEEVLSEFNNCPSGIFRQVRVLEIDSKEDE